jgi:hypothetical protein
MKGRDGMGPRREKERNEKERCWREGGGGGSAT